MDGNDKILDRYFERFINFQRRHLQQSIQNTSFESYFIGCGYSCVSLIGPVLWRRWDKPYIKAMADMLHENGKLLHIHFHGKCMEVLDDFVETGIDCVCPFERTPGDVNGLAGLKETRKKLNDTVAFNGNVHTVEALSKGTEQTVREQVREIREAFAGSPKLIIGTGDQVPGQTPEENIYAMIDEGRKEP
jgi:uroporphyrinogen-III decarboxylase